MDPLSISASIIALAQAVGAVAKGVRALRSIKNAPTEFCALCNEVATLQAAMEQGRFTSEFMVKNESLFHGAASEQMRSALVSIENTVSEIEKFVLRISLKDHASNPTAQIRKSTWYRERSNMATLREKARLAREQLTLCLSSLHSSETNRQSAIILDIREIFQTSTTRIVRLLEENKMVAEDQQSLQGQQGLANIPPNNHPVERNLGNAITKSSAPGRSDVVCFQASVIQSCRSICNCQCHNCSHLRSPGWLRSVVGTCFVSYGVIPILGRASCNIARCKARTHSWAQIMYFFPTWFLSRVLLFSVSISSLIGHGATIHIRVPRLIGKVHRIYDYLYFGDIGMVQKALAMQEISPVDVDEDGVSLLMRTVLNRNSQLISLFLSIGCDPMIQDAFGCSAVTLATRILYAESDISQEIREILRRVLETAGEDGALPRSTLVHGAVLGLNTQGLDEALNIEPWALDKLDGSGFSPLHWAVKRGDLPAVQTLLDWRPNLNLKTPDGYAALHLAAESAFSDICAMLLNAGSDPSPRDRFGRTPLHFAVLDEDSATKLIESFLRTGVDLNSQTIRGDTPLHVLTNSLNYTRNIVAKLRLLGDSGADVDLCDFQGRTPLMGMLRNAGWQRDSLDVVRALLDLGARLDAVDSSGCNIFHNIALSSGPRLPIINFLRTLNISGVSPDAPSEDGKTPLTYLMDAATRKEFGVAYASGRPSKADVEAFIHLVREVRERNWGARMFLELKDKAGLNGEQQDLQEWREYFDRILNILDGEETEGITAEEEIHDCHDETNDETFYDALESQLL